MNVVTAFLSKQKRLKPALTNKTGFLTRTNDAFNIVFLATDFLANQRSLFVVLLNLYAAQKYYDQLIHLVSEETVLFYPADELITAEMLVASHELKLERINTIRTLMLGGNHIVVTHLNGAIKRQLDKKEWEKASFRLKRGEPYPFLKLSRNLVYSGYEKVYTVEKVGQFSQRGNIIDIFPLTSEYPIRLDFFGDELENIKKFDIKTQRSFEEIDAIDVMPLNELFYNDTMLHEALIKFDAFLEDKKLSAQERERYSLHKEQLEAREGLDMLQRYITLFTDQETTLFDFVEERKIVYIDVPNIKKNYERMLADMESYCASLKGYTLFDWHHFVEYERLRRKYSGFDIEGLVTENRDSSLPVYAVEAPRYLGDSKMLISDLGRQYKEKIIILSVLEQRRADTIKSLLWENHLGYTIMTKASDAKGPGIYIIVGDMIPSFELVEERIVVLNESSMYRHQPTPRKIRYKSVFSQASKISDAEELKSGDYIVHYDYGIGQYIGIKELELSGITRDYITISYYGEDLLHVPIEQINLIQKYNATESAKPKLTKLGGTSWVKTKQRVKNKINDISDKLLALYAAREATEGFAYDFDDANQEEFELDFEFEETPDQIQAIQDVKIDMQRKRPMDRLICGDVGYGKTEVAMRAAFKAVLNGKQVAYLAPTTVLARQHYYSFYERFEKFGANIALMNRFTPPSSQRLIIQRLKDGQVDVVIGTHRLLSHDIEFKDLGLLIVDEEQRFGVEHKERIKEMKVNVDALTLSATPIPRTLQMAMMGIKDLSMIETPPKNRYPIQTYVLERHPTIVKEAIERELARQGQVFYLYNKVKDIDLVAASIQKAVPEARVIHAHGQMSRDDLEDVIASFIDHRYDILVCTTIIETGIDIPNTNTLIIHDADRLGLAQLYQIRGRVGRSDRIAYAYLMYDRQKKLTESAHKRLEVIKEFTELGSGFKIAMRDLSIRGAGDILGDEQSGFIDSVGIELYMKLLEETISEKKGIKTEETKVPSELGEVIISRHIPKHYVESDIVRIEMHKKIHAIKRPSDIEVIEQEFVDRFGWLDEEIRLYMHEKLLKKQAEMLQIDKIIKGKQMSFIFNQAVSTAYHAEQWFMISNKFGTAYRFSYEKKRIQLTLDTHKLKEHWLIAMTLFLQALIGVSQLEVKSEESH